MAQKSKLEKEIEVEIAQLQKEANNLYHKRNEILAKLEVLNKILNKKE